MPNLTLFQTMRLYGITELPDENKLYACVPFQSDKFNKVFDGDKIDDELELLCDYLYGGGEYYPIDDEMHGDDGNIHIQVASDCEIVIRDISKDFACTYMAEYYILVNEESTEYCWIIAEPLKSVYSG